jgi:hypothetical protein
MNTNDTLQVKPDFYVLICHSRNEFVSENKVRKWEEDLSFAKRFYQLNSARFAVQRSPFWWELEICAVSCKDQDLDIIGTVDSDGTLTLFNPALSEPS